MNQTFDNSKTSSAYATMLCYPNVCVILARTTDRSDSALEAVLEQNFNRKCKSLGFFIVNYTSHRKNKVNLT